MVEKCRNADTNNCRYSDNECWFIHENDLNENNQTDKNDVENDMIKKIFDMMATFEARILYLESKNK